MRQLGIIYDYNDQELVENLQARNNWFLSLQTVWRFGVQPSNIGFKII